MLTVFDMTDTKGPYNQQTYYNETEQILKCWAQMVPYAWAQTVPYTWAQMVPYTWVPMVLLRGRRWSLTHSVTKGSLNLGTDGPKLLGHNRNQ